MGNIKTKTTKHNVSETVIGKYRWIICSLLFFSTTLNYLDRNVIGYLKEYFCSVEGFGWTNMQFSYVTSIFTGFYAFSTIFAGIIIDKIGTKIGLALSVVLWSFFGALNAFAGQLVSFHILLRAFFGVSAAANFPASIKTIAEWFPKKERALATSLFNAGANVGAMLAAVFVPWCMMYFGDKLGWKMVFVITGLLGLIWLVLWLLFYNTPEKLHQKSILKQAELSYIQSDDAEFKTKTSEVPEKKVKWSKLLTYRQTWSFAVGKFMTDGVWWFLLFWLPDYLRKQFGMSNKEIMIPTFIVFGVAIVGAVFSGSLPLIFMNKGWHSYKARMTSLLLISLFPFLLIFTQIVGNVATFGSYAPILAIAIISIGAAAHCGWSANIFSTVSDMFPKKAVASIIGIGATAGGIGGILLQLLPGYLTDLHINNPEKAYNIMFLVCASLYFLAWIIMKILVPKNAVINL